MDLIRIASIVAIEEHNAGVRSRSFNMHEFKQLTDYMEVQNYARKHLTYVGHGSSRTVYVLTNKTVLKVATHPTRGPVQNEKEAAFSATISNPRFIARVIETDPDFNWIISEMVRPFHLSVDIGSKYDKLMDVVRVARAALSEPWSQAAQSAQQTIASFTGEELELYDFINDLTNKGYSAWEITLPSAWGRTADGRFVLADYGADREVLNKHY